MTNKSAIFVGRVQAIDRDFGDTISYSISSDEHLFIIDQNGNIWTEAVFDREVQNQYNLTIIAMDNSTAESLGSTLVQIEILDINDNYPVFLWPDSNEIRHVLSDDHSQRLDPLHPTSQFITDIVVQDDDIGNNSFIQLQIPKTDLFYIGSNHSLWLRNASITPGTYEIEIEARNFDLITKKTYEIVIYDRNPFQLNLFSNMRQRFSQYSLLTIIVLSFLATGSTIFILIYYTYSRLHYSRNGQKHFYGSRLIVNDEDKSKENSPQTKISTSSNHDYAVIVKQRKNSQHPSGTSTSTTDGDFSSSLLSCPATNILSSSSIPDINSKSHQPSSTVSALTTLTRKSTRRSSNKNVSFEPTLMNSHHDLFDDLFQNTNTSFYHETTPSTFCTLPKSNKRDMNLPQSTGKNADFPTLQTVLNQNQFPQPPPLLNGILLLDQMLTNDERTQTTNNSGWYNVTSNYQTKASIV